MSIKFVNVVQDGDLHIWCFDLIVMIEIIVEHKKKTCFLFSQIFYYKLNFLIQKSDTQNVGIMMVCLHTLEVKLYLASIEPNSLYALILIHCVVTQRWLQSLLFSCFVA
jgi:hypothetical protein